MKKKILLLIPSLQGGGAERFMATLAKNLDRSKFIIYLAIVDCQKSVYLSEIPSDVCIIDLKCKMISRAIPRIINLAWKLRPDILFVTLVHLNLAIAIVRIFLPNKMRVIARETVVLSSLYSNTPLLLPLKIIYKLSYRMLDRVISQSKDMETDLIKNYGLPKSKSIVINNPVNVDSIVKLASLPILLNSDVYDEETINLVASGRLEYQKGFDILIQALSLCCNKNYFLTVLGDGKCKSDLLALAEKYGVSNKVNFIGFIDNPYPYYAKADIFILCSRFEGFPNVLLEVLACGTPIIATPAPGGVLEILKDIDGCKVIDSMTPNDLAMAILDFPLKLRISPKSVDNFSVDKIIKSYENIFLQ